MKTILPANKTLLAVHACITGIVRSVCLFKKASLLAVLFFAFGYSQVSAQSPLCASSPTNFGFEYVSSITINGVTKAGNTGYSGPGYYDYTGTNLTNFVAGNTYSVSVVVQTNGNYQEFVKLWFDFNGNQNLEDAGELVFDQNFTFTGTHTYTGNITVPANAYNGAVYLRAIMVFSAIPQLCGNYSYGNTFDFKATISGGLVSRALTVATAGSAGSVTSSPSGINTASGINSSNFSDGSVVNLTATPSGSSAFVNWSGSASGSANPVAVTMNAAKSITANFAVPLALTTTSVSSVTGTTAASGGTITSDGGTAVTARGVCWNTTGAPTTANSKTTDGTGTGTFSSAITGLSPNTTYYARGYATNASTTAYGNQVSFLTLPSDPTSVTATSGSICTGSSTQLTANGAQGTVYWYSGSCGGTFVGTGNTITVSPGSTTTYFARNNNGSFSNGCASTTVTVNALPTATVSPGGANAICQGTSLTLTAGAGSSYQWYKDGSIIAAATAQTYNTTVAGSYSVIVFNAAGCSATSASTVVTVNALPTISGITGALSVCSGKTTTLTAASAATAPVFRWYNTSTGGTALFTGASFTTPAMTTAGTYYVEVTNGSGCTSSARTAVNINIIPFPEANATAVNPTTFCSGGSVVLSAATYALQLNGSNNVTVANGFAATDDITYEATVTPTSFATGGFNVIVNHDNYNTGAVHFQFTNGTLQFSVSGNLPNDQYATYTFNTNTTYKIAAVYSKSGKYVKFYVNGVLANQANYSTAGSIIGGNAYNIGAWNNSSRYFVGTIDNIRIWNLQRSASQLLDASNNVPVVAGTAGLLRYYRFDEGTGTTTSDAAGNGTGILVNSPSWSSTTPAGATYLWSAGAATTQNINAGSSGNYTVQVTNTSGCSVTSDPTIVTVNPLPTVSGITGTQTVCAGSGTTLTAASAATSPVYKWYNAATGGTLLFTGAAYATGAIANTTTYYVDVTNNNNCISSTRTPVTVTVNPLPTATISGTTAVCQNATAPIITFTGGNTTAPYTFTYTINGGAPQTIVSSGNTATVNVPTGAAGTFVYALVSVKDAGATLCTNAASGSATITVNSLPVAMITPGGPTTFCTGNAVVLTASAGSSFLWSNGATTQSITVNTTGNYSVTVTNASNCSATSSVTPVTVNPLPTPTISAGGATTFCSGGSVVLTASAGSSYSWSNGATTQSITVNTSGNYSVTVTNTNNCSATSAATTVTVNALPNVTAAGNSPVAAFGVLNVNASGADTYSWTGPNSYTGTGSSISLTNISGANAGVYTVTGTTTATGCANNAAVNVAVSFVPATGLNFDGVNDYVEIADNNNLNFGSSDFTVETWVNKKANSSSFSNSGVVAKWNTGSSAGTNEWLLQTTSGSGSNNIPSFWMEAGSTLYQCNATTNLQLNTWYHLAAVREGTTLKIYVNGVLEGAQIIPANAMINNTNLNLTLGAYRFSNSPIFSNMSMDELRIWNRALCMAEIQSNKDCELNAEGQTGLVSLYHFNQGLAGGDNTIASIATVPGAPTINAVVAGNTNVAVNFTAPASDGGSPITSYIVKSTPGNITATGTSSPITVPGLVNGTSYTFTMQATNAAGSSAASNASAAVVPKGVPGPPANVIASSTAIATRYSVSFTAPVSNGGSAITSYTVTASPGGITATGAASPILINNLTLGVTYRFTVTATNSAGTSVASAQSGAVTPSTVPGAPTGVAAVASGNTSATVSFFPPASNGGLPVTSYRVTSNPGGLTATGSSSPVTIAGLTPGTSYTFTVTATNSKGTGVSSAPSQALLMPGGAGNAILLVYNAALGAYLNAASGYIFNQSDGSETDPVDGSMKVNPYPAGQVPATIVTPQGNLYVSYDAISSGRYYTYRFSWVDPTQGLEYDRNGEPFASLDPPLYLITSDLKVVDLYDGISSLYAGVLRDPVSGTPITGVVETFVPLQTPGVWLLPAPPTASLTKRPLLKDAINTTYQSTEKTGATLQINDQPSYVTGPYDYNTGSTADLIELSGNITNDDYQNTFLSITDLAPAGSATSTGTLIDATGNNNGTLNGFALTGNTSNWTIGIASGNCANFIPPTTPVTGVTVVCAGSTTTLSNATAGGLWSSSNTAVATVSTNGTVTGMSGGTAIISYTNNCGGMSTATVTVNTIPTATVTAADVLCAGAANGSIAITAANGTAPYQYSKDGGANYQSSNSFTGLVPGTYNVIIKSATGCVSASQQVVINTVTDITKPVPNVANLPVLTGECSVTVTTVPTATDECTGNVVGTTSDPLTYHSQGTYTITWSYNDGRGNIQTQTQTVIVKDVTAPTIVCAADQSVVNTAGQCSAQVVVVSPTVTDNCSGYGGNNALNFDGLNDYVSIGNQLSNSSSYTKEAWLYTKGTNASGNIISADDYPFWIVNNQLSASNSFQHGGSWIQDPNQFPVQQWTHVAVTYDASASTMKIYKNGIVVASTNAAPGYVAGNLNLGMWGGSNFLNSIMDEVRIWNVARTAAEINANMNVALTGSPAGLVSRYSFDQGTAGGTNTSPVINTLTNNQGNASFNGSVINFGLTGANSNWVSGAPALSGLVLNNSFNNTSNASGLYPVGTTNVVWTVTDAAGNVSTCTQLITVTAPDINLTGNSVTIARGDLTPSASDNTDLGGTLPGVPVLKTYTIQNTGTSPLTVSSIGISGSNAANFAVSGITFPKVIAANASITFNISFTATAVGVKTATVTVNSNDCDEASYAFAVSAEITCTMPVFANTNAHLQSFAAANSCNAVVNYALSVSGIPMPALTYTFTGATSATGAGTGSGQAFNKGITMVTVSATNACGTVLNTFDVTVIDNIAPVVSAPQNISVNNDAGKCGAHVTVLSPSATDNCGIATTVGVRSDALLLTADFPVGSATIVWTVTDNSGLSTIVSQTVTVTDTEKPVPVIAVLPTITQECSVTVTAPTATDNCSGIITGTTSDPLVYTAQGTYTIRWTYTDASNNSFAQTQTVVVHDVTAPVADIAALPVITGECTAVATPPTATDNCVGTVTATTNDPLSYSVQGTYTITWTYYDGNGNTSAQTQVIVVKDVTPPVVNLSVLPAVRGECTATVTAIPTATDNCSGTITGTTTDPLTYISQGTYTITWRFDDGNGNISTQTQTVIVKDITVPVINCNADVTHTADAGACGYSFTPSTPAATDNCSVTVTGVRSDNLALNAPYPVGITTIAWTATDIANNTTSCTQTITVTDNERPVILTMPTNITVNAMNGACATVVTWPRPTAADNCAVASIVSSDPFYDIAGFTYLPVGVTTIHYTITDIHNNQTTASFSITVVDNQPPVITGCPSNIIVNTASGRCTNEVTWAIPVATDNCPGVSLSTNHVPGETFPIGTTTVTYTATDHAGLTTTCSFTVTVVDNQPPLLAGVPSDKTVSCDAVPVAALVTATDNCEISVPVTYTETRTDGNCSGNYILTRTWSATDAAQNTITAKQVITVQDITSPVLSAAPANVTVECNAIPVAAILTATDNCSTPVVIYNEIRTDGSCSGNYTLTRTWTATDACGNTSSKTQAITVQDTQSPILSDAPVNVTVECNAIPVAAILTATDNCSTPVVTYNEVKTDGNCSGNYTLTRTWTATDACGNASSKTQVITVQDTQSPILSDAPVNVTVECNAIPVAAILTATDNCSTPVVIYNEIRTDGNCSGNYTLTRTWTATDACGNTSSKTQVITVQDTQSPILSDAPVNVTVECNAIPAAAILTATDNCSTPVVTYNEVRTDGSCSGNYTLTRTWTATDVCGNASSKTQVITVQDTQSPILSAAPSNVTVECNAVPAAAILTATDNCSTPVVTYNEVKTDGNCSGNYTLTRTWTATDACGNASSKTQVITVQDTQSPILSAAPADVTVECNAVPAAAILTATDNCSTPVVTYNEVRTYGLCAGNYTLTRTWTATDACGNTSSKTQVITVRDTQAPILGAAPANITVECNAVPAAAVLTATDNCATPVVGYTEVRTNGNCPGNYTLTRTWTATDACGNSASKTQVITVQDTQAPILSAAPANVTVECNAIPAAAVLTATDNCATPTVVYTQTSTQNANPNNAGYYNYTLTRKWTATDACGNSSSKTQVITVQDTQKPVVVCPVVAASCNNLSGNSKTVTLTATDNCGPVTVTYTLTGATILNGGTGASLTQNFNVGTTQINWTVKDVSGNTTTCTTTVVINALPVATITAGAADAFCNSFVLTGSSTLSGPFTYQWLFNNQTNCTTQQLTLGLTNPDGVYTLYTTDGNGCRSAAGATYNYQKQNLVNSYTILTYKDAGIGKYNKVLSGSIGVMTSKGEADFKSYSSVTGVGSFVKAPRIDKNGSGIVINSQVTGIATPALPVMQYNTVSTRNLPDYTVSQYATVTLNGNYDKLTIRKGANVTVTGNTFGTINVEYGASIRFTNSNLNIESLLVDDGAKDNYYSYIRFAPNTAAKISNKVSIGSQVRLNPDNNRVTIYMGDLKSDEEKFTVKGGDTRVIANILMPNGKLRVTATDSDNDDHDNCDHRAHSNWSCKHRSHGHNACNHGAHNASDCNDDVYMTGLFIVESLDSKGNTVIWNSYDCGSASGPVVLNTAQPPVQTAISETPATAKAAVSVTEEDLKVTVMPNPSTTFFTLKLESKYETPVNMRVMDARGRVVDAKSKIGANSTLQIGHNYSSGTYYAELIQGTQRKVVQLIKARG